MKNLVSLLAAALLLVAGSAHAQFVLGGVFGAGGHQVGATSSTSSVATGGSGAALLGVAGQTSSASGGNTSFANAFQAPGATVTNSGTLGGATQSSAAGALGLAGAAGTSTGISAGQGTATGGQFGFGGIIFGF